VAVRYHLKHAMADRSGNYWTLTRGRPTSLSRGPTAWGLRALVSTADGEVEIIGEIAILVNERSGLLYRQGVRRTGGGGTWRTAACS